MLFSILWHTYCGYLGVTTSQKTKKLTKNNKQTNEAQPHKLITNLTKGKINPYELPAFRVTLKKPNNNEKEFCISSSIRSHGSSCQRYRS